MEQQHGRRHRAALPRLGIRQGGGIKQRIRLDHHRAPRGSDAAHHLDQGEQLLPPLVPLAKK